MNFGVVYGVHSVRTKLRKHVHGGGSGTRRKDDERDPRVMTRYILWSLDFRVVWRRKEKQCYSVVPGGFWSSRFASEKLEQASRKSERMCVDWSQNAERIQGADEMK